MNKKLLSIGAISMAICTVFCAACANGDNDTKTPEQPKAMTEEEWQNFWQNEVSYDNATMEIVNKYGSKNISYEEYEAENYELPTYGLSDSFSQTCKVDYINAYINQEIKSEANDGKLSGKGYVWNDNAFQVFSKTKNEWRYQGAQSYEASNLSEAQEWVKNSAGKLDGELILLGLKPLSELYSEFTFNAEQNAYTAHLKSEFGDSLNNKLDVNLTLKIDGGAVVEMSHDSVQYVLYDDYVSIGVIKRSYKVENINNTVVFTENELDELLALIPDND